MKLWNPWFEWMSFLVGLVMTGAAWIAVREYWDGERELSETVWLVAICVLLAIGAFWISLRWGRVQQRMRAWRWDEKLKDAEK